MGYKTLITDQLGGFPLVTEDLDFVQDAASEPMHGILQAMTDGTEPNSFVVKGCVGNVSAGTITIDAGWLFFQNELIKVDSHSLPDHGVTGTYYWTVVESFDTVGDKTFEDTSVVQAYKIRKGVVVWDAATLTGKSTLARVSTFLLPLKSVNTKLSDPYVYGSNEWGLNLTNLNAQNSATLSSLNSYTTYSAWTVATLVSGGNLVCAGGATYSINTTFPFSQFLYRRLNKHVYLEFALLLSVTVVGNTNYITFTNPLGNSKLSGIVSLALKKNSVLVNYNAEIFGGTDDIVLWIGNLDVLTSTADTIVYGRIELFME